MLAQRIDIKNVFFVFYAGLANNMLIFLRNSATGIGRGLI